jgi:hypothetical protein
MGCSTTRLVSKSEFDAKPSEFQIAGYTTLDGESGEFAVKMYNPVLEDSLLVGQLKNGRLVKIRLSEIQSITAWEYDNSTNTCLGFGILGLIVAVVLAVDYLNSIKFNPIGGKY